MRAIYTLIFVLIANFCFGQDKGKDPFIGLSKKEVIAKWGMPTSARKDAKGGEVLTYVREHQEGSTGSKTGIIRNNYYIFFINPSDVVSSWKLGDKPTPKRKSDELF